MNPPSDWFVGELTSFRSLSVPDPEQHRAHFLTRLERSHSRQPRRYLENFEGIRRIQRYILIQAKAHDVPQLEMWDLDESVQTAAELTVHQVISWAGRQLWRVGS